MNRRHAWVAAAVAALLGLCVAHPGRALDAPAAARDEFHFVVLGDSQFDDPPAYNRMIDDVRALRPAFVIQVGDMINGYLDDADTARAEWQRFRDQIAPLGTIPFLPVPGNHDTYGSAGTPSDTMARVYREIWGDPYYSFCYRNACFIVLNSDSVTAPGAIDAEQMAWLANTLQANQAEHIFVFVHRPPSSLANFDALHALLRQYPVRYVFFGHLHHYQYETRDGIGYVMTNASGDSPLDSPETGNVDHFLAVYVRDDEVGFAGIEADSIIHPESVAPESNEYVYRLTRALQAIAQVPVDDLTRLDDGGYALRLLLSNPTPLTVHAYLEWTSPDRRWRIGPERGTRVTLPAQTRGKAIDFSFHRSDASRPEGWPSCRITIPVLTPAGHWVTVQGSVSIVPRAPKRP